MDANMLPPNPDKNFSKLPPHATQASRLRYEIAQSLADMAPSSFGQERVLTGSSSRGVADEYSDIEMMFYVYAQTKFPNVPVKHIGMQELSFVDAFDCIICMDAMEIVFPEDWPLILRNFAQALHEHGLLYFTVEIASKEEIDTAYEAGQRLGLPLLYGEYAHHGGYHYYPTDEQVQSWLAETPFALLDVTEGDDYRHYLAKKQNG